MLYFVSVSFELQTICIVSSDQVKHSLFELSSTWACSDEPVADSWFSYYLDLLYVGTLSVAASRRVADEKRLGLRDGDLCTDGDGCNAARSDAEAMQVTFINIQLSDQRFALRIVYSREGSDDVGFHDEPVLNLERMKR